jgi:hypothetical protein
MKNNSDFNIEVKYKNGILIYFYATELCDRIGRKLKYRPWIRRNLIIKIGAL